MISTLVPSSKALTQVATIGPKGEPQNYPAWFGWDGKYVRFSQTKTGQKYHNPRHEPQIAPSMVEPENPCRYLEIRGEVIRIEEDPNLANLDFINSMAKKDLGLDKCPNHQPGDERVVLFVEPRYATQMGR